MRDRGCYTDLVRTLPILPIDDALPALLDAVRDAGVAVLVAPPGAGKTTRVPGALLDAGLVDGKIWMLQPRRVAARASARRIAEERGVPLGGEVGYQVRFDRKVGPETQIEIITEGLLTRRIQQDPFLEDVGLVIIDEFHERSLSVDLGLALLAEIRASGRDDLKIVVMSATLDPIPVATFLGGGAPCPIVESAGRTFPVSVQHSPKAAPSRTHEIIERVAAAVAQEIQAMEAEDPGGVGHLLAFLPGAGEIDGVARALAPLQLPARVYPLHGRLPPAAQDEALRGGPRRKIILATNIAETSLTVDGVIAVVDSGLARVPRFDPGAGVTRLERAAISQASADQRAGRAGRTRPGRCLRLWTEADHSRRPAADTPEIARADLASTLLEIYSWGSAPDQFGWFEAPDPRAVDQGITLLQHLGALDDQGLTSVGRALAALPTHPRLGRAILAGRGVVAEVATVAALAEERDIFIEPPKAEVAHSDLDLRLAALQDVAPAGGKAGALDHRAARRWGLSPGATERVIRSRDQLIRIAAHHLSGDPPDGRGDQPSQDPVLDALLAGFPDRVAQRRAPQSDRFKMASGAGAKISPRSAVRADDLILAVGLEGGRTAEHLITTAWALDPARLPITEGVETRFDPEREAVVQFSVRRYLALVLDERPAGGGADPMAVAEALAHAAAADPLRAFRPDDQAKHFLRRLWCAATWAPGLEIPALRGLEIPGPPDDFILTQCMGRRSFADLRRVDLIQAIRDHIGYSAAQAVDRLAPDKIKLPGGATARVTYTDPDSPPVFSARIQHLFGMTETPKVGGGRVALLIHLLAPNMRPMQITSDLAGFWANTYADVRKDLRGRYPKHPWPEDPLTAPPVGPRHRRR